MDTEIDFYHASVLNKLIDAACTLEMCDKVNETSFACMGWPIRSTASLR